MASSPPEDTLLRQVDNLTSRVNSLELQVKELSESHHANQVVKTKKIAVKITLHGVFFVFA